MRTVEDWARLIEMIADSGLRRSNIGAALAADAHVRLEFARDFADDMGHRRAIDPHVLAWILDLPPFAECADGRVDLNLWHALRNPSHRLREALADGAGPLSPQSRSEGIEVWTEIELASLQALWWLAAQPGGEASARRARSHARWLMDELQPDNATNRPWAIAVFAALAAAGDGDAALYADTMLHNCQVTLGRPDRLSTLLLVDAARRLRA